MSSSETVPNPLEEPLTRTSSLSLQLFLFPNYEIGLRWISNVTDSQNLTHCNVFFLLASPKSMGVLPVHWFLLIKDRSRVRESLSGIVDMCPSNQFNKSCRVSSVSNHRRTTLSPASALLVWTEIRCGLPIQLIRPRILRRRLLFELEATASLLCIPSNVGRFPTPKFPGPTAWDLHGCGPALKISICVVHKIHGEHSAPGVFAKLR